MRFSGSGVLGNQAVITKILDGSPPNSILVDFSTIEGVRSHEAEWFTDGAMTPATRDACKVRRKKSEGECPMNCFSLFTLLTSDFLQYWFRVRAIRANQAGPMVQPGSESWGVAKVGSSAFRRD
jgi:hypothetical protein